MVDYEKIKKLVEGEIDKITALPEMNDTTLSHLDKLVDILKDVEEMEIGGNSQRTMYGYYDDGVAPESSNSYRGGNSYRNGSNYRYGNSYRNNGRSMRGYSMNSGRDEFMEHLEMAMDTAQTERERQAIQELMNEMTKM